MIPKFPSFKKIQLSDKKDVEKFTHHFPSYSDFSFFSMWGWDIQNKIILSELNGNLVVVFNDYVSGDHFVSFIGDHKAKETAEILISFSKQKYKNNFLKLIPEEISLQFKGSDFVLKNDRDSFDYIYLVEYLANMKNWTKNTSGKKIRKFIKNQPDYVVKHSSINNISHKEYEELFKKWAENKSISNHFDLNEYKAFKKFLQISNDDLKFASLYINKVLVGFTLYEILPNNYAISHFAKADHNYDSSIYDLLNWEEAKYLHSKGVKYFNWEQDMGILGLRYSKIKYKPAFFLRKLIVEKKSH